MNLGNINMDNGYRPQVGLINKRPNPELYDLCLVKHLGGSLEVIDYILPYLREQTLESWNNEFAILEYVRGDDKYTIPLVQVVNRNYNIRGVDLLYYIREYGLITRAIIINDNIVQCGEIPPAILMAIVGLT